MQISQNVSLKCKERVEDWFVSIVLTEYTITLNTRAEGSTDHAEVLLSSKYLRTLFICEFIRNVISGRVICMQRGPVLSNPIHYHLFRLSWKTQGRGYLPYYRFLCIYAFLYFVKRNSLLYIFVCISKDLKERRWSCNCVISLFVPAKS